MIALVLIDNLKKIKVALWLAKSCKICLFAYIILFIVRVGLFFEMHSQLQIVDSNHQDKGIGAFFAEYIDDDGGSKAISLLLLAVFGSFYIGNILVIK